MCEPSNDERADWALDGLMCFAEKTGLVSDHNEEELSTIVSDFLCNLRHLCSRESIGLQSMIECSEESFREEVELEAESESEDSEE